MKKLVLLLFVGANLFADDKNIPPKEVQQLLSQEMQYIKSGMDEMLYSIISNDYKNVAKIARTIEHSYILKDKITQKQKQQLQASFPAKFFEYDMEFHESAQSLADFADFDDKKNLLEGYSNMVNQCVRCHESFAKFRFEKFHK
jgi:hypothetical protein